MSGSRLGWTIAAVIVLVAGAAAWFSIVGARTTRPTAFSSDPRNFAPLLPPGPSSALLPATTPGDGGPVVREAIELYLRDRPLYDDFATAGKLDSPQASRLDAVEKLIEAATAGTMTLLADRPEQVIGYRHTNEPIEALRTLGRVMVDRLALLSVRAGRPAAASRYAHTAMTLGLHLCRERICFAELELGLELVGKSAPLLARLAEEAGETDRAAAWRTLDSQRSQFYRDQVVPVLSFVRSIDPPTVGARAGDLFELAKRSRERMWRVEAVLSLGRMRYFAGQGGSAANQRAATALVTELAESEPDPVVRAAARAARDLTVEEFRMQ